MKQKEAITLIKKYVHRWTYRIGLGWWAVDIVFYDDPDSILREFGNETDHTVLATTYADWRYSTAKIYFNAPAWCKLDEASIERYVLHELCHVLVNEMREGEAHHEERVVSSLQKAFLWTEADILEPDKRNSKP